MQRNRSRDGFTLIELLIVIAIIAVLIGILLPSLAGARNEGRALRTGAQAKQVALGVESYSIDYRVIPPSYVYPDVAGGHRWTLSRQIGTGSPDTGYLHWSWMLFNDGRVPGNAFESSAVPNGGAPATNPGSDPNDWELGQVGDAGSALAPDPLDQQVKRLAFVGNAAVFPRNKFGVRGNRRRDRLVDPARITFTSNTILLTEFLYRDSWSSVGSVEGGLGGAPSSWVSKSHRSITPFIGGSAGTDPYNEPVRGDGVVSWFYPRETRIKEDRELGAGEIVSARSQLNAVGRHHPGGTVNFVYMDGHVERKKLIDTVKGREWGDRFYSITGGERVDPRNTN